MAGGAADCQFWEAYLAIECRKYQLKHGERVSVAAASRMLINILNEYKGKETIFTILGRGLSMGIMIAGQDKSGPHLYYIDDDGTRCEGNIFSIGSGSTYAYGILDTYYKYDLELQDAVELGKAFKISF
jgi:20S proteasome subunit beta 5